jgi:hypothetical protein
MIQDKGVLICLGTLLRSFMKTKFMFLWVGKMFISYCIDLIFFPVLIKLVRSFLSGWMLLYILTMYSLGAI